VPQPKARDGLLARTGQSLVGDLVEATRSLQRTIGATEDLARVTQRLLDSANGGPGMAKDGSPPAYVSLADAAKRTGRHPDLLRRWCSEGRIPAIRVGRNWALSQETVTGLAAQTGRSRPASLRMDGPRKR
jgi:excisionase family DNA binding protein